LSGQEYIKGVVGVHWSGEGCGDRARANLREGRW
jgi:hypothetical protein